MIAFGRRFGGRKASSQYGIEHIVEAFENKAAKMKAEREAAEAARQAAG